MNLWSLGLVSVYGLLLMLAIAIATKVIGCGIPVILVTCNRRSGISVGVGMISRGEVGLIVAGIGLTTGAITQDVYAQIVAMAIITTIVTPILLRHIFRRQLSEDIVVV